VRISVFGTFNPEFRSFYSSCLYVCSEAVPGTWPLFSHPAVRRKPTSFPANALYSTKVRSQVLADIFLNCVGIHRHVLSGDFFQNGNRIAVQLKVNFPNCPVFHLPQECQRALPSLQAPLFPICDLRKPSTFEGTSESLI
jgi:hypothetical protein